ncbi:FHA domain-containing protein [Rubripirellula amarantea]|nr:FHA domain-containing protein [Rubripirellula amarantea]
MPICPACRTFVDEGAVCRVCGAVEIEVTSIDPLVPADVEVALLRPHGRPMVARLIIVDDDSDGEGEIVRLRRSRTTIGRRDCEVRIPHDADVSATHATIARSVDVRGNSHWTISDEQSTNGTFVRVDRWTLDSTTEFRLGGMPLSWQTPKQTGDPFCLVELSDPSRTIRIHGTKTLTLGRQNPSVEIAFGDETISPVHAELIFDGRHWMIEDLASVNGVWVRVNSYTLTDGSRFILGQQRFLFRCPSENGVAPDGISFEEPT